jgi:hypothetical protein
LRPLNWPRDLEKKDEFFYIYYEESVFMVDYHKNNSPLKRFALLPFALSPSLALKINFHCQQENEDAK